MDSRQMRYALVLAREGHFGRAARDLGITQPSLSRQIAGLEADLDVQLFRRERSGVVPTAAGYVLLGAAARVEEVLEAARIETLRASRGETGALRIAFIGSALPEALLPTMVRFRAAHPAITVSLTEMSSTSAWAALAEGTADIAFGRDDPDPVRHPGIVAPVVRRSILSVVMSRQHPLAGRRQVTVEQLAPHQLVVAQDGDEPAALASVAHLLAARPLSRPASITTRDVRTMVALAAVGLGIGTGPDSLRAFATPEVWVADVTPTVDMPPLRAGFRDQQHDPAVRAFLSVLLTSVSADEQTELAAALPPE